MGIQLRVGGFRLGVPRVCGHKFVVHGHGYAFEEVIGLSFQGPASVELWNIYEE